MQTPQPKAAEEVQNIINQYDFKTCSAACCYLTRVPVARVAGGERSMST